MADGFRRHDLVRVEASAFAHLLRGRPDLDGAPDVADWAVRGRPLIVRRYGPGEDRSLVPLGLPLPPAAGKRRIGLALPFPTLAPLPAPTLAQARGSAPEAWQPTIEALLALGTANGLVPRPFGALLWQALTGLAYLAPTSDLDLLWPVTEVPPGFLASLAQIAAAAPMRIDGEVILPDGAGIHWRELHEAGGAVLAKHRDRLEMRDAAGLRAQVAA
ncbi:malonate decarboxylase holo-[acyl-carrier-protein] synthase [Methylobacterium gregans]|uniref:Phosphoribosyl-dephospho-CoA transferase n=1 Tax=Methylobacterium gregans TaxID=374424 RepID=A0AA37MCG0_9HYPH|nr:malonate decarboxylase holo-[acyl-carrier-protein] synthase [Methylobacterium gregans]MDQ0523753.1 phosphoribosyl-dephospho-CoA transferase [Methylobacterium gregans]GJD81210.1 Phosphoribosyl-dephospho-CoA transferase [Methylobacterium gregans]GLS54803.1 phosphoribosyl-dephospho-CoA transferase [Methylobacterium gregans]